MSNFTQEELIDINVILGIWLVRFPYDIGTQALVKKLELMINDNRGVDSDTQI